MSVRIADTPDRHLREALLPFARVAADLEGLEGYPDSLPVIFRGKRCGVTLGDFRRARAALFRREPVITPPPPAP